MGGNALKNTDTERKSVSEYQDITKQVVLTLKSLFPEAEVLPIVSYANKDSFGDSDILINSTRLPHFWKELVIEAFKPNETYDNGPSFSFDFRKMQIDLIKAPEEEIHFTSVYFAYNDLGNFIGRIAHRMGYRYGHSGLRKLLRENTTVIAEIMVSQDPEEVFKFLGYDYDVWLKGFSTLDEIYRFASSTPYFSREVFNLDNNNHENRTRDRKRPNYTGFLEWMKDKPELDRYQWAPYVGDVRSPQRDSEKGLFLSKGFKTFPGFKEKHDEAVKQHILVRNIKEKWNGEIVGHASGLTGKSLGLFIARCKDAKNIEAGHLCGFNNWVLNASPKDIKDFVVAQVSTLK